MFTQGGQISDGLSGGFFDIEARVVSFITLQTERIASCGGELPETRDPPAVGAGGGSVTTLNQWHQRQFHGGALFGDLVDDQASVEAHLGRNRIKIALVSGVDLKLLLDASVFDGGVQL